MKGSDKIKQAVKKYYSKMVKKGSCCGCSSCGSVNENEKIAESIGYSKEEVERAGIANLGLGCGNPTGYE